MEKEYIKAECINSTCSHWNDPCCQLCTEVVYYNTSNSIDLMFIGMGAGKDEDINSNPRNVNRQPWVGRAGNYLRSIILDMWQERDFNIALSNTVRCHPKDENGRDRAPSKVEESSCLSILYRDILRLTPHALVTCGKAATIALLPELKEHSMGAMRGSDYFATIRHESMIMTFRVVPTYHPSFLTRQYGSFKSEELNKYDEYVIQDIWRALNI